MTERPRTRSGSMRRLVELTEAYSREHDGLKQVAVTHGGAEEDALQVIEEIKAKGLFQGTFLFGECGAVLMV